MQTRFYVRGFMDRNAEASMVYFKYGMRIASGTVGSFVPQVLLCEIEDPFVFESKSGDMAVGGVWFKTPEAFKRYAINAIMSRVKRNHADGMKCAISSIASGTPNSLMVISAIEPQDDLRNGDEDYKKLEAYLDDWVNGNPGVFV